MGGSPPHSGISRYGKGYRRGGRPLNTLWTVTAPPPTRTLIITILLIIILIISTPLTPLFLSPRGVESSCAVSPELVLGSALADLDDLDEVAARRAPPPDSLDARAAPARGGLHSARPHGCPGPLTPRTPRPPKLLWRQDGEVEGHDCRTGKATS